MTIEEHKKPWRKVLRGGFHAETRHLSAFECGVRDETHAQGVAESATRAARHLGSRRAGRGTLGLAGPVITTLVVLLCASCGGGQAPSGSGSTGEGGGASAGPGPGPSQGGSVVISVGGVTVPGAIHGTAPDAGRYLLAVEVTLRDVSALSPVPTAFAYYSLMTAKGLSLTPSMVSALVEAPCPSDVYVAREAEYACAVVFEVPEGDSPTQLSYDDDRGDSATAPVSTTPPAAPTLGCNTFVTFTNADSSTCLSCVEGAQCADARTLLVTEEADGRTCPAWETDCQTCAMEVPSPATCACWDACLGGCQPALDAVFQCLVAECARACM